MESYFHSNLTNTLYQLRPEYELRNGQVVKISSLIHLLFFIIGEFFRGEWNNSAAKREFSELKLEECLDKLEKDSKNFAQIAVALKIDAKLAVSHFGISLQKYAPYQRVISRIEKLREEAAKELPPEIDEEVKRWILSTKAMRIFAAANHGRLPFYYRDVKPGSILLTNINSRKIASQITKRTFNPAANVVEYLKAWAVYQFTGKLYDHSDLMLNSTDKIMNMGKDSYVTGIVRIQDRLTDKEGTPRVCFQDIFTPQEEIFSSLGERDFAALLDEMTTRVEEEAVGKARASFWDIIRAITTSIRPKNYDITAEWSPEKNSFSCAGTIAALYGMYGIDIGKPLGKTARTITPADFSHIPDFFQPYYIASDGIATWTPSWK